MSFYEKRSSVCLQMRYMNLETWVEAITNETVYCDELGLMGLCYMYHQHCVVLTHNKLWSTVQADKPMNLLYLLNICSIQLIYLGNLRFGVLTWRPYLPKKVATKSPGFNIIEEYTLYEANVTSSAGEVKHSSSEQNVQPVNVETSTVDCESGSSIKSKMDATVATITEDTKPSSETATFTSTGVDETSSSLQRIEIGSDAKPKACASSDIGTTSVKSALHVETKDEKQHMSLDPNPTE